MAGVTIIAVDEPKFKKSKVMGWCTWWRGDWVRGERMQDPATGLPGVWDTKTRGPFARAERYRKLLHAQGVDFTVQVHASSVPEYTGEVVKFIFK